MKYINWILIVFLLSSSFSAFGQFAQIKGNSEIGSIENDNNISIMLSDVIVRRVSLEYEHVFSDGKIAFHLPISITLSPYGDLWSDEVHWWVGMGIKFYPTGQGFLRYFLGAEFRLLSIAENDNTTSENHLNTAFLINNGLMYSPTNNFFVSVNLGLGFLSRSSDSQYETLVPYATPSFRLGFKF